jgi:hypothetical protein
MRQAFSATVEPVVEQVVEPEAGADDEEKDEEAGADDEEKDADDEDEKMRRDVEEEGCGGGGMWRR